MRTLTSEELENLYPQTGRTAQESGVTVNVGDTEFIRSLLSPSSIVARKQGYFWQDLRESIATSDTYYYRLKAPSDKHLVILNREINAGEGPVRFETLVLPSSFTPGTMITPTNLYTGGPASGAEVEKGVVPTGGTLIPADFLFGAGNKTGTAGSSQLPTILPPGLEIFAKITNESAGTNPGIRFALAYGEVIMPTIPVI